MEGPAIGKDGSAIQIFGLFVPETWGKRFPILTWAYDDTRLGYQMQPIFPPLHPAQSYPRKDPKIMRCSLDFCSAVYGNVTLAGIQRVKNIGCWLENYMNSHDVLPISNRGMFRNDSGYVC